MTGSKQKIIKGVYWTTIYNVVNAVYGFISVPLLISYFGKAEYGLIGLAMSVNVYMQLMDLGFNSTNVRFFSTWLAEGKKERVHVGFQTSLWFYGIVGIVNALILGVFTFFAGSLFNVSADQAVILKNLFYVLMASAVVSWYSSCLEQVVRATENVAYAQKMHLVPKLAQIVVLVLTLTCHLSILSYFLLTSLAIVLIIPLFIKKIRNELSGISFKPVCHKEVMKEMLPYCLNIFSFSIFQFSFYNLRPFFLGIRGTIESVADYRVLNGLVTVVTIVGSMFINVLLPSSSKVVANNDRASFDKIAYDGTKYITILISFCCFGMMAVGKEVLSLYVGDSYLYLLPWLNIWLLCTLATHNQAISSLILAGSDIRAISYCSAISSIVGLAAAWMLIPRFQTGGVVWAFVIYLAIQLGFYYLYYWPVKMSINSRRVFFSSFLPFIVIGLIVALPIMFIPWGFTSRIMAFGCKGCLFSLLFISLTIVILSKEDRIFFRQVLCGLFRSK